MTKDNLENNPRFYGDFVKCGKLVNNDWVSCLVKLLEIKAIEDDKEQKYTPNGCIFYTSKDVWYVFSQDMFILAEKIESLKPFNPAKYIADKLIDEGKSLDF